MGVCRPLPLESGVQGKKSQQPLGGRRSELCLGGASPGALQFRDPHLGCGVGWGSPQVPVCTTTPHSPNSARWSGGNCSAAPPPPTASRRRELLTQFSRHCRGGREGGGKASLPAALAWGRFGSGKGDPPCRRCLHPLVLPAPLPRGRIPSQSSEGPPWLGKSFFQLASGAPSTPQPMLDGESEGKKRKKISAGEHPHSQHFLRTLVSITEGRRRAVQISGRRTAPTLSSGKFQEGPF